MKYIFTGSRNVNPTEIENVNKAISNVIKQDSDPHYIVGGAVGFDTLAALHALNNKIPYTLHLPNETYGDYYWKHSPDGFKDIVNRANKVIYTKDVFPKAKYIAKTEIGPVFVNPNGKEVHANKVRNQAMILEANNAKAMFLSYSHGGPNKISPGTSNALKHIVRAKHEPYIYITETEVFELLSDHINTKDN